MMPKRCLIEMEDGSWMEGYVTHMEIEQRAPHYETLLSMDGDRSFVPRRSEVEMSLRLALVEQRVPDPEELEQITTKLRPDYRIAMPKPPPVWPIPVEAQATQPEDPEQYKDKPEPPPPATELTRFSELETDEEPEK